jgi:hypothetical protein
MLFPVKAGALFDPVSTAAFPVKAGAEFVPPGVKV